MGPREQETRSAIYQRLKSCFVLLPLFVSLITGFAPFAPASDPGNSNSHQTLTRVSIQLRWLHQFQFAGYYAAQSRGFFAQEGLDVELRPFENGLDSVEEVTSGRADFGVGLSDLILRRSEGAPIVILGPIFQHSPLAAFALKGGKIANPQQFIGKKLAFSATRHTEITAMLAVEGISLSKIDLIPFSANLDATLKEGPDVIPGYTTSMPLQLERRGIDFTAIKPLRYGIDFYGDTLFTSETFMNNRSDVVEALWRATQKGWTHAMSHPEETIETILREYPGKITRDELLFEASATRELVAPDLVAIGHSNPGRWQHIADVYRKLGVLRTQPRLEGFFLEDYLRSNEKRLVQWSKSLAFALATAAIIVLVLALVVLQFRHRVKTKSALLVQAQQAGFALEQNYRRLHESIRDAFVSVDLAGRIREFNSVYCDMLGYSEKEISHLTYQQLTPLRWHETESRIVTEQVMKIGYSEVYQKEYIRKDGTVFPVELRSYLLKDDSGNPTGMWAFIRDISERRRSEEQMKEAKESAERANQAKSEFLAHMSHEIRTPLNGIIGALDLLAHSPLSTEQLDLLRTSSLSAENLLVVVNDILDFSKMEAGRLLLEEIPFGPRALFDELREMFNHRFQAKEIGLEIRVDEDLPNTILGDPLRLKQIVSNLLGNALKFTHAGGASVWVSKAAAADGKSMLKVEVNDSGIGIQKEMLAHIFDPFVQADSSTSRHYGGTGLGLSICKRLVNQLGGEIWVESTPGKGSRFEFTITLKDA